MPFFKYNPPSEVVLESLKSFAEMRTPEITKRILENEERRARGEDPDLEALKELGIFPDFSPKAS